MTKKQRNLVLAHWKLTEEYRKYRRNGGTRVEAIEKTLKCTAGQCLQLIHREQLIANCLPK